MALSIFDDKSHEPTDRMLADALGRSKSTWDRLKADIAAEYAPLTEEWNYPGAKYGWSLRLKRKKRAVLYMTPCPKRFRVALVLGEKAVKAAHQSSMSAEILKLINTATKYPEGRGIRIEVRRKADLAAIMQLAAIKMAN